MKLFKTFISKKNGEIVVWRSYLIGAWQVGVNNCGQTTTYTNRMWKKLTQKLALKHENICTVLIGGLGGGGHLSIVKKFFPNSRVDVIEHDPVMIDIARIYRMYKPSKDIKIIEGDMFAVLPTLTTKYDLICVDLFFGEEPSPITVKNESLKLLTNSLSQDGILVVNMYKRKEFFEIIKLHFQYAEEYQYRDNHLGMFWN